MKHKTKKNIGNIKKTGICNIGNTPTEARRFSMRRLSLNFAKACLKGYSRKRFVTIKMNSLRV
jgi:hypothetical protein